MLSKKHELFCLEYLSNGLNATQAYKTVYKIKNIKSAETLSSKLLRNVKVEEYIKEFNKKTKSPKIITAVEIKEELTKIIKNEVEDISQNPLANRLKAMDMMGKILQMFTENVNVKVTTITPKLVD